MQFRRTSKEWGGKNGPLRPLSNTASPNLSSLSESPLSQSRAAATATAAKWAPSTRKSENAPLGATPRPVPTGQAFKDGAAAEGVYLESSEAFWAVYEDIETIGKGSFAKVKEVEHRGTRERFAAKIMDKGTEQNSITAMATELKVLAALRHPNVIRLYAAYETPRTFNLVTELATGGELMKRLAWSHATVYSEDEVLKHVRTIAGAIHYMHSEARVAHRDLKPENILLSDRTEHAQIKIVDLGLSRFFERQRLMRTICGTHKFLAPELIECDRGHVSGYGPEVDMWGLGVITYIMLFGINPFERRSVSATHNAILECRVPFPRGHNISAEAIDFIRQLLLPTPGDRLTSSRALATDWLTRSPSSLDEASCTSQELVVEEEGEGGELRVGEKATVKNRLMRWNAERMIGRAVKSVHRRLSHSLAPSNGSNVRVSPLASPLASPDVEASGRAAD